MGKGSMPDWPGYVVRMMREVTDDFRVWGVIVGEFLVARLAGPNNVEGGDDDNPLAAFATCTGSRLGESVEVLCRG